MRKALLIALSLFAILMVSRVYANNGKELILQTELEMLSLENPKEDLTERIGRDDYRFIGLYGYAAYFPGLSEYDYRLVDKHGALMLEGTSDFIESEKHQALIQKAKRYAEIYNIALLKRIKEYNVKPKEGYVPKLIGTFINK